MTQLEDRGASHATHEAGSTAGVDEALMEAIIAAIRTVHDPEIPVNVYDLGLIYRIEPMTGGHVEIDMTLTAPGCPVAGELLSWVEKAVVGVEGISGATIKLVFDPPWDNSRMSEDVQLELGLL
ncbi:iron-sulfur cluster assembly protein [Roseixanthobacter finlandensis]|uniref:iron-sulfur cluster assembly protein n=1 Tax=Roseixanthobacter finlandensis TaxID=3119922 RepID=UPI00372D0CC3